MIKWGEFPLSVVFLPKGIPTSIGDIRGPSNYLDMVSNHHHLGVSIYGGSPIAGWFIS
jgi:hypothetical protein